MKDKKTIYEITIITAALMIGIVAAIHFIRMSRDKSREFITVGFVYDGDESTPFTANFIRAEKAVERDFGDRVRVIVKSNVSSGGGGEQAISELVNEGCDLIFTTSIGYAEAAKKYAGLHPEIQFCEATAPDANDENGDPVYENYHTFMGEIYQGRYISGVVAGMKLKELLDQGILRPEEAKVGYVAAYSSAEVISGYTAFFLGVRSIVPEAVMEVKYTNTWSNYNIEKQCADELIDRGCVIISQHSDTTGPAVACEERYAEKVVYHVGYNKSMIDIAPTTSLISARINWEPYISGACEAVLADKKIEKCVKGNVHGNDIGAGFEREWVEMLELNSLVAAEGSKEKIDELIRDFEKGKIEVFRGDYIGVDPDDPGRTVDLSKGYTENEKSSAPSFSYVLKDVITIVE